MSNQPRYKATINGETLSWFDTLEEAEDAINNAANADAADDAAFEEYMARGA